MNKVNVIKYCGLAAITALILFGIRYFTQYLFSATVDWNIAIGVVAIALPLLIQICAALWNKQKENQLKIEQAQDSLNSIPLLQKDIEKIKLIYATMNSNMELLEERLQSIEEENRRQERLLARTDAVLETIIQQEQLHARVDKLSEAIAALQVKTGSDT